jgi:hypothetical protein
VADSAASSAWPSVVMSSAYTLSGAPLDTGSGPPSVVPVQAATTRPSASPLSLMSILLIMAGIVVAAGGAVLVFALNRHGGRRH